MREMERNFLVGLLAFGGNLTRSRQFQIITLRHTDFNPKVPVTHLTTFKFIYFRTQMGVCR